MINVQTRASIYKMFNQTAQYAHVALLNKDMAAKHEIRTNNYSDPFRIYRERG